MKQHVLRLTLVVFAMLWFASVGMAQSYMTLTVVGPSGVSMDFALSEFDALPQHEVTTSTIWTEGTLQMSGPSLSDVLDVAGVTGTTLILTALNDYSVDMPVADLEKDVPIIATRMNGEPMTVRGKGPFWIIYPYDSDIKYQTETVYARSIWQLSRVMVQN
jgi:hypothetical protein